MNNLRHFRIAKVYDYCASTGKTFPFKKYELFNTDIIDKLTDTINKYHFSDEDAMPYINGFNCWFNEDKEPVLEISYKRGTGRFRDVGLLDSSKMTRKSKYLKNIYIEHVNDLLRYNNITGYNCPVTLGNSLITGGKQWQQ